MVRKIISFLIIFFIGICSSNTVFAAESSPENGLTKNIYDSDITNGLNRFSNLQSELKNYYGSDFQHLEYNFVSSTALIGSPPDFNPNDPALNSSNLKSYLEKIEGLISAEKKGFGWERFTIPDSFGGGEYKSFVAFDAAYLDKVTPIMKPLNDVISKLIPDGSGNGYSWNFIMPNPPKYIEGDASGNFKRLNFYTKVLAAWVNKELPTISIERVSKSQPLPENPSAWIAECDAQSTATSKSLLYTKNSIDLILSLLKNQPALMNDANYINKIELDYKNIRIQIDTWLEKLPIYFQRQPKCTIYSSLLEQVQDLKTNSLSLRKLIDSLSNSEVVKSSSVSSSTNTINLKLSAIKNEILKAEKASIVSAQEIKKADGKFPIVCVNLKTSKVLVLGQKNCPKNYSRNLTSL